MFYIANIILSMGIQSIARFLDSYIGFITMSGYGNSYNTFDIWFGIFMLALALYIIIRRFDRKHSHNIVGRIIGVLLIIAALGTLINKNLSLGDYYFSTILGKALMISSYLIPGILILVYNKPIKSKETPEININPVNNDLVLNNNSKINLLRTNLKKASKTKYAKENEKFLNNLNHSNEILKEIQDDNYKINPSFIEQINRLTNFYLELEDNKFQTEQSSNTLAKIVETFDTIDEALENIYDKNFSEQAMDIEGDIITMKTTLNMEGALDSPFEKIK